jgi:hypothetical protein
MGLGYSIFTRALGKMTAWIQCACILDIVIHERVGSPVVHSKNDKHHM